LVVLGDFLDIWKSTRLDSIPVFIIRDHSKIDLFVLK